MIVIAKENRLEKVDEKILLITIIGSLETVKKGGITIDEAEKFLFSPYMVKKLKAKRCDKGITNLIMKGCELEDIVSLMPEKFNDIIEELKQEALILLKKYEEYNDSFWM
ncbi:MAG: DUF3969 family protein [Lachnospiraceae bacterium]|nr:DUF3969 family protein [Lachnospiraceae bacterium]